MKMFKAYAAIIFVAALPCVAEAQTAPVLTYGQVLTPAQWMALFAGKQDYLGAQPLLTTGGTLTGPVVTAPSTATISGFNIPLGVAPTSPNNGDLWTTPTGLFAQVNGSTFALTGAGSSSFTANNPLAVTFPSTGVVNYALNFNASLALDGSNNLGINLAHSNSWTASQTFSGLSVSGSFTASSLALGGATIGSNALAVTGTVSFGNTLTLLNGTISSPSVVEIANASNPQSIYAASMCADIAFGNCGTTPTNGLQVKGAANLNGGLTVVGSLTLPANSLTLAEFPSIGANTVLGSIAGGTPAALSKAQITSLVNVATASFSGAVPAWPNTTTSYFRGDGSYQTLNFAAISGLSTFAQFPSGTSDTLLGYFGGTTASASAISNCSNALTYSTTTHTFGCNTTAGTGTVTSVATAGLATGGPITSAGTVTVTAAVKTDMQNASLNTVAVTPGIINQADGVSKVGGFVTISGGVATLQASQGTTSFTRTGVGLYTIAFSANFASANYWCTGATRSNSGNVNTFNFNSQAIGSVNMTTFDSGTLSDPLNINYECHGRQ